MVLVLLVQDSYLVKVFCVRVFRSLVAAFCVACSKGKMYEDKFDVDNVLLGNSSGPSQENDEDMKDAFNMLVPNDKDKWKMYEENTFDADKLYPVILIRKKF